MGTDGNEWHKKGQSGCARGYKCVIIVLSRNKGKALVECLLFLLCLEVMENGMTEKQKIFADEYIICLNATKAYKKAYPNVKKDEVARANGSRLLTNANVKAYIDEQLEKLQSERVADQQEVLEYLTAVMRGKKTEPLLVLDGEGKQKVVDAIPPVQARTKAAELLGKRYRLFTDKVELDATVEQVVFEDDIS